MNWWANKRLIGTEVSRRMEGKSEGEFVCYEGWFLQDITDVIVAVFFGGLMHRMEGQLPQ